MIRQTIKNPDAVLKKPTLYLFLAISAYLVLPVVDFPFLSLSIAAPAFFLVVLEVVVRPPRPWSALHKPYIILAVLLWLAVFLSASFNGLLSGGADINAGGVVTVIQFSYWLLIFNVVTYVVTIANLPLVLVRILGWSVLILALLRWGEAILFGSIGAEFRLVIMPQNSYGMQFSTFFPYLLGLALFEKGWAKRIAFVGNILLLGAVAINGSRGSWVGIGIGLVIFLLILFAARQRVAWGLTVMLILTGVIFLLVFSVSPQISQAVQGRLNSFQNLDDEKSYAIRQLMIQKSIKLFQQSPIFGVGAGRFRDSSVELDIPLVLRYGNQAYFDRKSSHNSYMSFLAENGLIGAIPFGLLLILFATRGLNAAISLARQKQYWGVMIYTGFISASVQMWVISTLVNTATWFMYGLVAAMIILTQTMPKEQENK